MELLGDILVKSRLSIVLKGFSLILSLSNIMTFLTFFFDVQSYSLIGSKLNVPCAQISSNLNIIT